MTRAEKQNRVANDPRVRNKGKSAPYTGRALSRLLLMIFCLALMHALAPKTAVGQDSAGEYELKAAMLYNLTLFVEWPPSAYSDPQTPTVLCILGRDPFGDSLASIVSNQDAGHRPLQIRHVTNEKDIHGCHILYISPSERKRMVQIFSALKGSSVLTVGETAQFAARGGMIQFSLEDKQVRFEINLGAASEADIKISSRLLLLARIVKEQNKNPAREGSALRAPPFEVARVCAPERWSGARWHSEEATISSDENNDLRRSG